MGTTRSNRTSVGAVPRTPIGRQIVERANQSIEEFGGIFDALGLTDAADAEHVLANMAALKESTPEARSSTTSPPGPEPGCRTAGSIGVARR